MSWWKKDQKTAPNSSSSFIQVSGKAESSNVAAELKGLTHTLSEVVVQAGLHVKSVNDICLNLFGILGLQET